ncbi:hypothetical protein LJC71_11155 [Desulfosarcina sp. OttesenSCG-928-A07]|nr:hypothetical protein [Desulfosarcina sp. OttesenSCG-928-A07]
MKQSAHNKYHFSIDLDLLKEARPIDTDENLIFKNNLTKLWGLINNVYDRIEEFLEYLNDHPKNKIISNRIHEIITIHGRRGAGKTTFVLSALQQLSRKKEDPYKKIKSLGVVDPTVMNSKENLFFIVLDKIRRIVDQHRASNQMIDRYQTGSNHQYEDWHTRFRKLATGLGNLEGSNKEKDKDFVWGDPQLQLDYQLDLIRHGEELELDFHLFLDASLKVIEKKAFLIVIDDIDTAPEVGWKVLDIMRKYFTSPQLITIISGDLDLYSSIVRNQQYTVFKKEQTKKPPAEKSQTELEWERRIEGLVDQYLLKLLPIRNRIVLPFFGSYVEEIAGGDTKRLGIKMYFPSKKENGKKEKKDFSLQALLKALYDNIMGLKTSEHQNAVQFALLDRPFRTVIQMLPPLMELNSVIELNKDKPPEKENSDEEKKSDEDALNNAKKNVLQHLSNVFFNPLQRMGYVDVDDQMTRLASRSGITDLMTKLESFALLERFFDLSPCSSFPWANACFVTLQAHLSYGMRKNPASLIHYMVKIALIKEIMGDESLESKKDLFDSVRSFLRLGTNEAHVYTTCRLSGLERRTPEKFNQPFLGGTVIFQKPWMDTKYTEAAKTLLLFTMFRLSNGEKNHCTISVLNFLGMIADFLAIKNYIDDDTDTNGRADDPIRRHLQQMTQESTFYGFNQNNDLKWSGSIPKTTPDGIFYSNDEDEVIPHMQALMLKWKEQFKTCECAAPAPLMARIGSRFYKNLLSIDIYANDNLRKSNFRIQEYIYRCVTALLSSILVEEHIENNGSEHIKFFNPTGLHETLCENLTIIFNHSSECHNSNKIIEKKRKYNFFHMVASFPILLYYLEDSILHKLTAFGIFPKDSINSKFKENFDHLLKSLVLIDKKGEKPLSQKGKKSIYKKMLKK